MGSHSSYLWKSKADVVRDTLWELGSDSGNTILRNKVTKDGLWTVIKTKDGKKVICFSLITKEKYEGRNQWWVKSMDESVHPYYYDCPVEFLEAVPANDPVNCPYVNLEWRNKVLNAVDSSIKQKEILKTVAVGQVIKLVNACVPSVKVYSVTKGNKSFIGLTPEGKAYQIKSKYIDPNQ